jgi:hypothetical protein
MIPGISRRLMSRALAETHIRLLLREELFAGTRSPHYASVGFLAIIPGMVVARLLPICRHH